MCALLRFNCVYCTTEMDIDVDRMDTRKVQYTELCIPLFVFTTSVLVS